VGSSRRVQRAGLTHCHTRDTRPTRSARADARAHVRTHARIHPEARTSASADTCVRFTLPTYLTSGERFLPTSESVHNRARSHAPARTAHARAAFAVTRPSHTPHLGPCHPLYRPFPTAAAYAFSCRVQCSRACMLCLRSGGRDADAAGHTGLSEPFLAQAGQEFFLRKPGRCS